jgi:putative transposase
MGEGPFSEEQIISVLKEHRKRGISDATFYTWRSKYGGMEVSVAHSS